jgi:hypothetical protein
MLQYFPYCSQAVKWKENFVSCLLQMAEKEQEKGRQM